MSEISDAITIVVSEETGVVSVAYDCTLTRNYTIQTLRNYLTKILMKETQVTESK
jgi:diadenylate cyclase